MPKLYLGIDLGGTEVKIAVVDEKGNILEQKGVWNSYTSEPKEITREIVATARGMKHYKKLSGTGVGVAGDIDQKNGVVRFSPNLSKWKNLPLKRMLQALPKPIVIDNDANAAAWGAYWLDAGGKVKNLVAVTLGTGVGGGLICDGKLFRGATGTAGEIGHITLDPSGPLCNCGNYGCIERYAGAPFLSAFVREEVKHGKSETIARLVNGDLEKISPHILSKAAKMGDHLANEIWRQTGERLGIVMASIVNLVNPEMIVFSGGVSQAGNLLLGPVRETIRLRAFKKPAEACKVVVSKHTNKLGVVGAAFLSR